MPALTTAFTGSVDVSNRRASTSGQRRFESGVAAKPSVIELPIATIVPVTRGFRTSTPERKIHDRRVVSAAKVPDAVELPDLDTYVVCTPRGWRVEVLAESGR